MLKPALGQGLLIENKSQLQFIHDKVPGGCVVGDIGRSAQVDSSRGRKSPFSAIPEDADLEAAGNLFTIVSHLNLARIEKLDPRSGIFSFGA